MKMFCCYALCPFLVSMAATAIGQDVLFVVNDAGDVEGNQSVVDRLTDVFGFNVTVIDDDTPSNPVASDAEGQAMVIISSTVLSSNVGTAFTDQDAAFRAMEIPVVQWESALHDEYLFSDSGQGVDTDTITVTDTGEGHFLAAGLAAGDHVVRDSTTPGFHVGSPSNLAPDFNLIAEINGNPALGVVEPGGLLNDGSTTASARRIDAFFGDASIVGFNDLGIALFDASINYALGIDQGSAPGDFNGDGMIDLADYGILLENFNERFKVPESLTKGDVDFNGRVNLADFAEFRAIFNALPAGAQAVPEPTTSSLASLAAVMLFLMRRRRART